MNYWKSDIKKQYTKYCSSVVIKQLEARVTLCTDSPDVCFHWLPFIAKCNVFHVANVCASCLSSWSNVGWLDVCVFEIHAARKPVLQMVCFQAVQFPGFCFLDSPAISGVEEMDGRWRRDSPLHQAAPSGIPVTQVWPRRVGTGQHTASIQSASRAVLSYPGPNIYLSSHVNCQKKSTAR